MAATGGKDQLLTTSPQQLTEYLDSNITGPHRVVLAFLDALRKGHQKTIVLISSQSGSLTKQVATPRGFMGPYVGSILYTIFLFLLSLAFESMTDLALLYKAVTKAALNMMAVQLHNELHKDGFIVVPLHPGTSGAQLEQPLPSMADGSAAIGYMASPD